MRVQFIGNGGHAGNLRDICRLNGVALTHESRYLVLAYGGVTCEKLEERYSEGKNSTANIFPNIIHPTAIGDPDGIPNDAGIQIMALAVMQHNAKIGEFSIINTAAIIEHDVAIGRGCHIAPGAVVLGDVKMGDFCFVGANAVIVQGSTVPDRTFIRAGEVWKS